MRLSRLTKLAVVVALAAPVVPAAVSAASATTDPGPVHPVLAVSTPAAERALSAVEAAFAHGPEQRSGARPTGADRGGELTLSLLELQRVYPDLSAEDRQTARAYLARPTDGSEYYGANYGKGARPTNDCKVSPTSGSNVCVTWARKTADAPSLRDSDDDGLPNQVEKTRDTMNHVWRRIVDKGGYEHPLPDKKGPDAKLDIYLVDIGDDGLYGYCGPESVGRQRAEAAYCVLDDDYAHKQFPSHSALENLQVTAAHEFFHAVQFGYDAREDAWFMESTATWMEDEVYDDVNDNRGYLSQSAMQVPDVPLDSLNGSFLYGNWIWWRYLTERFPAENGTGLPTLVKNAWELADNSGNKGTYSVKAMAQAIAARDHDLGRVFADFGAANRTPVDPDSGIYEEGDAYTKAPLSAKYDLTKRKQTVATKSPRLAHLTNTTVAFVPSDFYTGDRWHLKVDVDLPGSDHEPFAQLTVFRTDGSMARRFVKVSSDGVGSAKVPFSSRTVKRVELTLTDGDHSYDCNRRTSWSCEGVPDEKRTFEFSATAVR